MTLKIASPNTDLNDSGGPRQTSLIALQHLQVLLDEPSQDFQGLASPSQFEERRGKAHPQRTCAVHMVHKLMPRAESAHLLLDKGLYALEP